MQQPGPNVAKKKKRQKDNPQNGRKHLQMKQQRINLQNMEKAHGAQYQKNEQYS